MAIGRRIVFASFSRTTANLRARYCDGDRGGWRSVEGAAANAADGMLVLIRRGLVCDLKRKPREKGTNEREKWMSAEDPPVVLAARCACLWCLPVPCVCPLLWR